MLTFHVLEEQAARRPEHLFLLFEGREWSYGAFVDAVARVANWLVDELGVEAGEVVALDGGNSAEYLMLWMALDAVGACVSFVNWNLTGEGLVHCVKVCGSVVFPVLSLLLGGVRGLMWMWMWCSFAAADT